MFQVYFANKPIMCLEYQVCVRLAAKHTQMTHLSILSIKLMTGHVERIAPSTHDSSIQIRLKFDCVESVQLISAPIRHQTARKNSVQLSRSPFIAIGRLHTQLLGEVLSDPLCQFLRKKLQKGVVPAVGILKYPVGPLVAPSAAKACCFSLQQQNVQRWSAINALASTGKKFAMSFTDQNIARI